MKCIPDLLRQLTYQTRTLTPCIEEHKLLTATNKICSTWNKKYFPAINNIYENGTLILCR